VRSKNLTAMSPETAPKPSGSASLSSCSYTRRSSAVRLRFGWPALICYSLAPSYTHCAHSTGINIPEPAEPICSVMAAHSVAQLMFATAPVREIGCCYTTLARRPNTICTNQQRDPKANTHKLKRFVMRANVIKGNTRKNRAKDSPAKMFVIDGWGRQDDEEAPSSWPLSLAPPPLQLRIRTSVDTPGSNLLGDINSL
jgi:hypothetical protein